MAGNAYENAVLLAAPWAQAGRQAFQGQNAYEAGRTKMAQALAQQGQMEAHANLFNEQAGLMREKAAAEQQRRSFQTPEFGSKIASALAGLSDQQGNDLSSYQSQGNWGVRPAEMLPPDQDGPAAPEMNKPAPSWYSPDVERKYNLARGAHLANLGGTGNTNAEQMTDAFVKLLGQGRLDQAITDPRFRAALGPSVAAAAGKGEFNNMGTSGVFNQFSGKQELNDIGKTSAVENRAQANNANASAAQHLASRDLTRSKIGQPTVNPDGSVTAPAAVQKPMPVGALKLQQEGLENMSIASNINPMLQRFANDIDAGKLRLGPVANMFNKGKNFAGASDEGSRNFASFQATLEKLRNDSLRLNKGVQTDGDAKRAWNELMSNINDPDVVKQRINEIQGINERAVELHRMNVNQIRRNFGNPDIDVTGYVAPGSAKTDSNIDALLNKYGK